MNAPFARFFSAIITLSLFLPEPVFAQSFSLSEENRAFLQMVQKDSFAYFQKFIHPKTGLVLDSSSPGSPASIAATGFGLAAYGIAYRHGWIGYRDAYQTTNKILKTLEAKAAGKNGFYYHFLDPETGKRIWSSELSSIDTALLIAGAFLGADYFKGTDIEKRVKTLYDKIDWPWMLNNSLLFSHGWKPESGFLPYYWDMYSEHLILAALAMGSSTFPAPKHVWSEWLRYEDTYRGRNIVYSFTGSLFTYQFPHAFIDFRNLNDDGINYFENSKQATLANREFCLDNQALFPSYSETVWGLSASLGPSGYKAYGAKPGLAIHDGTVAPYSLAASVMFAPEETIKALRFIYDTYGDKVYGPYGFTDSFNAGNNWWAREYLGIDQGIVVLALENAVNDGEAWNRFMKLPLIQRWIKRAGLAAGKTQAAREVRSRKSAAVETATSSSNPIRRSTNSSDHSNLMNRVQNS